MKKIMFLISFLCYVGGIYAQSDSALYQRVLVMEEKISGMDKLQSKFNQIVPDVKVLQKDNASIKEELAKLQSDCALNSGNIQILAEGTSVQIDSVKSEISSTNNAVISNHALVEGKIKWSFLGIMIGFIAAIILSLVLYSIQRRRIIDNDGIIDDIRKSQQKLQEESVKLDNHLVELLENQMKVAQLEEKDKNNIDHSFAKRIADEIMRIEVNLSRMDSSIRGYKQLSASLRRIKDNFLASGYEIVDMLGKPYNDGMKVIASFVPDESLESGQQVITGIIKPQINFRGEMIQAAEITVSQNI